MRYRKRKKKRLKRWLKLNNKAVSAVIGVILMVALTVAIATTVYVYVSTTYEIEINEEKPMTIISGEITSVNITKTINHKPTTTLTINNIDYTFNYTDWSGFEVGHFYEIGYKYYNNRNNIVFVHEYINT